MSLNYDPIEIDRAFGHHMRAPYMAHQGYQNPYSYASGYAGAGAYLNPYNTDRKFGFKQKFEHSGGGWDDSKKKKSKKTAALSALTLLAFLFFLNLLQSCLKDHLQAINPTVMVLTAAASKTADDTVLPGDDPQNLQQRSNEQKSKVNTTFVAEESSEEDITISSDSFESFQPATHKSITKEAEAKPVKHYHIRRKQNGHKSSSKKHKSTTTISPKLMNYYNMKNDYY